MMTSGWNLARKRISEEEETRILRDETRTSRSKTLMEAPLLQLPTTISVLRSGVASSITSVGSSSPSTRSVSDQFDAVRTRMYREGRCGSSGWQGNKRSRMWRWIVTGTHWLSESRCHSGGMPVVLQRVWSALVATQDTVVKHIQVVDIEIKEREARREDQEARMEVVEVLHLQWNTDHFMSYFLYILEC